MNLKQEIQAITDSNTGKPIYSNFFSAGFTKHNFIFTFIFREFSNAGLTLGRYAISPIQAKVIRDLLTSQVEDYEKQHGEIQMNNDY